MRLGTPTVFPAERIDLDDSEAFLMPPSTGGVAVSDRDPSGGWYVEKIRQMAEGNENIHQNLRESMKECRADENRINDTETPVEKAAHDLLTYTKLTYPAYREDHFHEHLAAEITKLVMDAKHGKATKLMVFAPPQHGKSELVSTRTPGFWLANNQDLPVGLVSYAASLAYRNSRQARDVLATQQFFDIFRDMRDPLNWRQNDWHLLNRKGYCLAVGVGGAITGHGFGLGIVDDPVENWAAAQSETLRESIWAWWNGTFTTRLWQNASLLFIMTRWNEDDLAARILANEGRVEEGGAWKVLSYPALSLGEGDILNRPLGEPLAPSRYGKEYLEDLREKLGEYVWNAEYQQNPTPPKGSMFKVGRIEIVNAVPAEIAEIEWDASDPAAFPEIISVKRGTRFWDLAGTEKDVDKPDPDSTASALTVVFNDKTYILDVTNDRLEPEQVETLMLQTARVDGVRVKVRLEQEPGQSGKSQVGRYTKLLKGFDVEGIPSSGDKRVRASPLAAQVNAGNVIMLRGPWNRKFLDQIANFPFGKHDDMVDASSTSFNHETGVTRLFKKIGFKHV